MLPNSKILKVLSNLKEERRAISQKKFNLLKITSYALRKCDDQKSELFLVAKQKGVLLTKCL